MKVKLGLLIAAVLITFCSFLPAYTKQLKGDDASVNRAPSDAKIKSSAANCAVYGQATGTASVTFGGYFESSSNYGRGVYGLSGGSSGIGVMGQNNGVSGRGVYGYVTGDSARGVYGYASGTDGVGVYGEASNSGEVENYGGYFVAGGLWGCGVWALSSGNSGIGVRGESTGEHGYGVKGEANGTNGVGVRGNAAGDGGRGFYGCGKAQDFYAGCSGVGPFTGSHEVKLPLDCLDRIKTGMILSVTGQVRARPAENGSINISSTLPTVSLSSQAMDKKIFGVFTQISPLPPDHWYIPQQGEKFGIANALGEGRVWVSNINGPIEAGDYITSSAIPGYGQLQPDDLLHSYRLGKAIEDVDWQHVEETVEFENVRYKVYLMAVVYTSG